MNPCQRCRADVGDENPKSWACEECPSVVCDRCGELDDRCCSCWLSFEGMSQAELKALFAPDGFNVEADGRLTR